MEDASMAEANAPIQFIGVGFPTVVEVPPDIDSPFLSRRLGKRRLEIETVDDLIELLLPFRGMALEVDSGVDDRVEVVGDLALSESTVTLDVIPVADDG
jgi:hypothetical protein